MKADRKGVIEYLRPILESASLPGYVAALRQAVEDMERVEALEAENQRLHRENFEQSTLIEELRKLAAKGKTKGSEPPTNGDRIRAMNDKELAELLCTADWCEICDQMKDDGTCRAMEVEGPLCKHCVAAGLRWLQQK